MSKDKETRPSIVPIMEDGRVIRSVRVGSWGPLKNECALIEAYNARGRMTGPYTIDYLPGAMWKVFRNDVFMRYADAGTVKEMARQIALDNGALFESMAETSDGGERPNRGNYGPQPAVCEWIEGHDSVIIEYLGSDENWPTGCWQIEYEEGEQHVNEAQLIAIAKQLGMGDLTNRKLTNNLDDVFGPTNQRSKFAGRLARSVRVPVGGDAELDAAFDPPPSYPCYTDKDDDWAGVFDSKAVDPYDLEEVFG